MRRTIFHRKCDPSTRTSTRSPSSATSIRSIATTVDFSSALSSVNDRKSFMPENRSAVARIRRQVEIVAHPPDEILGERRAPSRDLIQVAARDRIMPRVKLPLRQLDLQKMNVARQRVVDAPAQRLGRNRRDDVEVRHLLERVHARRRSAPSRTARTASAPVTSAMTRVSSPCTVRAFFWICQPLYFVPAYSMKTLKRAILCDSAVLGSDLTVGTTRSHPPGTRTSEPSTRNPEPHVTLVYFGVKSGTLSLEGIQSVDTR